jgi:hypothetical protein
MEVMCMENRPEGKRGAPRGNRNALKHGFYSGTLDREERSDLALAARIQGIDEEIALLRLEIKKIVAVKSPRKLNLLVKACVTLEKMVRTRQKYLSQYDRLHTAINDCLPGCYYAHVGQC